MGLCYYSCVISRNEKLLIKIVLLPHTFQNDMIQIKDMFQIMTTGNTTIRHWRVLGVLTWPTSTWGAKTKLKSHYYLPIRNMQNVSCLSLKYSLSVYAPHISMRSYVCGFPRQRINITCLWNWRFLSASGGGSSFCDLVCVGKILSWFSAWLDLFSLHDTFPGWA